MLRSGMNLVALPMDPGLTAFDLAERIGPNLIAIAHLDPNTQAIERVSRIDGQVQGLDFQIQPYRGLIIEMTAAADLTIAGIPGAGSIDLVAGQHLIGLRGIPAGLDAAALLAALGGPGIVAAIRRYIPRRRPLRDPRLRCRRQPCRQSLCIAPRRGLLHLSAPARRRFCIAMSWAT